MSKSNQRLFDLPVELANERHLLVILPHPDDESFGCAGVMTMLRQNGVPVTYVCATGGQMGRQMGRPPFATRESLPALRRAELAEAMRIVEVDDWRQLGLWDKTLEFEDPEQLAARIESIIMELNPSTIITFHPEYGGHPDHVALGQATIRAVQRVRLPRRPQIWLMAARSEDLQLDLPRVIIDITAVADLKRAAFQAHRSQTSGWEERLAANPEMERRFGWLFKEERFWVYLLDEDTGGE